MADAIAHDVLHACPTCGRPLPKSRRITPDVRQKVKYLRFKARCTQIQIAAALRISQSTVCRILSGQL